MEINKALAILREVKKQASDDLKYGFDEGWEEFIVKMQFLSPKAFGTRIQNRIIEKNGFLKTNPSKDIGDFIMDAKAYEFKVSILNTSNKKANFVGIRPYQNINGYILIVIDTNSIPYRTAQYKLSKDEMTIELEIMKANFSNGTIQSNKSNKKVSKRFSIDLFSDSENAIRWENYKITFLKL